MIDAIVDAATAQFLIVSAASATDGCEERAAHLLR
jgi:hypothetical protein